MAQAPTQPPGQARARPGAGLGQAWVRPGAGLGQAPTQGWGLSPYQLWVFILCGLCLIMDGFDVQSIGYVAPEIISEWKIPNVQMGPVFSAGLFGLFLGS